ncbi:MAG TPA: phosphatase PAP2 family protein [Pyrinomonadaceae bacterium]|nr:phosphatase PAP2 family protein [Pyrinomonadaceae bacterium]
MRTAEWLSLAAFSFFIIASWLRPLTLHRRMVIVAVGAIGILLITATQFLPPVSGSVARDWLPALLMPMVYWQTGWFTGKLNKGFQTKLQEIDRKLLSSWISSLRKPGYRWIVATLELAYLSCYVLVPLGLAFLYLAGLRRHATDYWSVVLLATYPCYAFTAFVPTEPPRTLEIKPATTPSGKVRRFNMWIVRHFSIQLNTFPSAHVTATLGSSLVLLHFLPQTGLVFLLISIGIALGAVLGRYHYAADVLVAAALTVLVYVMTLAAY